MNRAGAQQKIIRTDVTGIGDPFVLREGDRYYMYATSAKDGFKVFRSDNLTDWTDLGLCYQGSSWAENDFWAPEVYAYRGRYYMFFTARWKTVHSLRLSVAISDSPEGPFKDVSDAPTFDCGYAAIDGTVFFDGGKAYFYYVRDCSENIVGGVHTSQIYGVKLKDSLTEFDGEPVLLTTPDVAWETALSAEWRWNEGPALLKRNGIYYMCYSVNCYDSRAYSVGYARAELPLGPFVKAQENPILSCIEGEVSGPGHNSFFTTSDGRLMTAYHIHTHYDKPSGDRRACFSEVRFDGDKLIIDYR